MSTDGPGKQQGCPQKTADRVRGYVHDVPFLMVIAFVDHADSAAFGSNRLATPPSTPQEGTILPKQVLWDSRYSRCRRTLPCSMYRIGQQRYHISSS
ncbi:hypothetical protein Cenrod_0100 [Candidatus Symbiobacter mobilis CR]|uniref:Uncharacterized protein n=1 Tax=Candidatus Symbiobacter mobilis CR TaxID=946483 RepID=U5N7Q5_9BURK|nr:hypothetical protein Cenrod_0100 [Candidatus Symbiobacter mobilis CR]